MNLLDYTFIKNNLPNDNYYLLQFDGFSSNGESGIGALLYGTTSFGSSKTNNLSKIEFNNIVINKNKFIKLIFKYGEYIGKYRTFEENSIIHFTSCTNNQIEYISLINSLVKLKSFEIKNILIESSSNLLINQLLGITRVKDYKLKQLFNEIIESFNDFDSIGIRFINKELNKDAIGLAIEVIYTKDIIFDFF
jgi:ribonuclease HI